ncbi:hypothetical protein [Streptomyces graminilatus]|uniref:hypothetical protein n=1 Tax=Streptomyces graminilatus TaxID=1464070 RepID=UPI0006E3CD26|nr:hypothetical protein [Streptomyces graminilatus]
MNAWHNGMALKAANCPQLLTLFTTSAGTVRMCNTHVRYCKTCNPRQWEIEDTSILEVLEESK